MQAESDIGPSLVLPSISEDDENQSDNDSKRVSNASPSKSPARSPRHGKFLQRYYSMIFVSALYLLFCLLLCHFFFLFLQPI